MPSISTIEVDKADVLSRLATALPREVDTVLSGLYREMARVSQSFDYAIDRLHYAVGDKKVSYGRRRDWKMTTGDAKEACEALVANVEAAGYLRNEAQRALGEYEEKNLAFTAIRQEIAVYQAEWGRRRWTRAFLVLNNNGHIHRTMDCSTTFPTTQWGWLPQASGLSEKEIVDAAGQDACTVCYPSAPVDVLKRERARWLLHSTEEEAIAEREKRAAEKAARQAKKVADGLTSDGSPLVIVLAEGDGTSANRRRVVSFGTERAATNRLVASEADRQQGYTYDLLPAHAVEIIVGAIAAKHGKSQDQVRDEIDAKVAAKIKRDAR